MDEAPQHPHNQARGTFLFQEGTAQPAPAPRFSRTVPGVQRPAAKPGQHGEEILREWGVRAELIEALRGAGAI